MTSMKIPKCSCGWMAVCTLASRIGVRWTCPNTTCQLYGKPIEPVWVEVQES